MAYDHVHKYIMRACVILDIVFITHKRLHKAYPTYICNYMAVIQVHIYIYNNAYVYRPHHIMKQIFFVKKIQLSYTK